MSKGVSELKHYREREGRKRELGRALTFDEAAAMVVGLDGGSPNKSTWHAWEKGRKVPTPNYMAALCDLVCISSDIFYPRRACGQPNTAPLEHPLLV